MKIWFVTTTSKRELQAELRRLDNDDHIIFQITTASGEFVIVSYTESV